ncbi:MAG TPA: DUF6174 domain-containing protein [Gemmatimonadaceae bacterium]|nr:DUF6174 domain-containing protein [Gemmatimonadaceae bacterium]
MTGLVRLSAALALVIGPVLGCVDATSPDSELEAARRRWADSGPTSYAITISRSCECTPEMTGPVVVSVRNRVVESRTYTRTGTAVASGSIELFPSVEGLFRLIADAIAQRAASLVVRYDPTLGHPIVISIDWDADTVDDEVAYQVRELVLR